MLVEKMEPDWKPVPHEPATPTRTAARMGFVGLTAGELAEAQTRQLENTLRLEISDGMGKALIKTPERSDDQEDKPTEFREYNPAILIKYGLKAWDGGAYEGRPCDESTKNLLDDTTLKWAARQIFDLSRLSAGESSISAPSGRGGEASAGQPSPDPKPGPSGGEESVSSSSSTSPALREAEPSRA